MRANQAKYPGATTWPSPDEQYLYGQKIAVPDVTGKPVKDAKTALQAAGFQAKTGGTAASDAVPAGSVISTDPVAGSQVSGGSLITITKSSGPQPVQPTPPAVPAGTVPNEVGSSIGDATTALAAAGYANLNVVYTPGGGQPCTVLSQTPVGGTPSDPAATQVALNVAGDQTQCQP